MFVAVLFLSYPVFARDRIVDNAGLISAGEKADLEKLAGKIAEAYSFDLVIVTEKNIGNATPMEYADDYFDYNGYGLGNDRDGCIFLLDMGNRDFWFSTSGRGIKILNNTYAGDKLESDVVGYLKNNKFFEAFQVFINDWEEFLVLGAKGRSYNFIHEWNIVLVIAAWVIAFIIGFLIVQRWKAQMNTALTKTEADFYMIPGSLAFKEQTDRFLYSTVSKTKRQTKSSSSSSGGTHRSSSGRSHGGRGGRF